MNFHWVFLDSIAVARRLDIPFSWIDALCITQDDLEDWAREASLMGSVYEKRLLQLWCKWSCTPVE
jgi:hypothetical protein